MTEKRRKKGHKGAQGNFCSDRQVHYLGYKYIYIYMRYIFLYMYQIVHFRYVQFMSTILH